MSPSTGVERRGSPFGRIGFFARSAIKGEVYKEKTRCKRDRKRNSLNRDTAITPQGVKVKKLHICQGG